MPRTARTYTISYFRTIDQVRVVYTGIRSRKAAVREARIHARRAAVSHAMCVSSRGHVAWDSAW